MKGMTDFSKLHEGVSDLIAQEATLADIIELTVAIHRELTESARPPQVTLNPNPPGRIVELEGVVTGIGNALNK